MSGTLKALRIVWSKGLALDQLAGAAGTLDLLARRGREGVRADRELGRDLASPEHLHRVAARRKACSAERIGGNLGAGVEAGLEVRDVHRLRMGPEGLERHRHLLRVALELARA